MILAILFSLAASGAWAEEAVTVDIENRPYYEMASRIRPGVPGAALPLTFSSYDYWLPMTIADFMARVRTNAQEKGLEATIGSAVLSCQNAMQAYARDGVLDIRYALGYFDFPNDKGPLDFGGLDWGLSVSADEGVAVGLRKVLTAKCTDSVRALCGFTEKSSRAERVRDGRTVLSREMPIVGRSTEVRITLTYASASPFYALNFGELRDKQARYTLASEENFFGGLRSSDITFYIGHARNGGGPDFRPPRLTSQHKVDYLGYYRKVFPGRDRMLKELRESKNDGLTLGVFSCDSKLHFYQRLAAQNPKRRMMLSLGGEGVLHYMDSVSASFAYLEGMLHGYCGSALDEFARPGTREKAAHTSFGLK